MSAEIPSIKSEETRTSLLLPKQQINRSVETAHTFIRSLPGASFVESMTYRDPEKGSAWLVVPYINERNGLRLSRFTKHDGTLEIITINSSHESTKEDKRGRNRKITVTSKIQWLTLNNDITLVEENTDVAAGRMFAAIAQIQELAGLIPAHETNPDESAYR